MIAHELGHLKCDHGVWLTVGNVLASGTLTVLPLLSGTVEDALVRWMRAAELTCDRASLLVAQDPRVVISVLMKLAGGCVFLLFSHEFPSHSSCSSTEWSCSTYKHFTSCISQIFHCPNCQISCMIEAAVTICSPVILQ